MMRDRCPVMLLALALTLAALAPVAGPAWAQAALTQAQPAALVPVPPARPPLSRPSAVQPQRPAQTQIGHPQPRPQTLRPATAAGWQAILTSGIIRAGVPADSLPFGYRTRDGHFVGLTVDLLGEIAKAASHHAGRPLRVQFVPIRREEGIRLIKEGRLDIVCAMDRPHAIVMDGLDPTFPYFLARTVILAQPEAAKFGFWGLVEQKVAVPAHLGIATQLETLMPGITLVRTTSMADALASFRSGHATAVAGLAEQLLEARSMMQNGASLVVLPGYRDLTREPLSCMVPPHQSHWRDIIDRTLFDLLDGFDQQRGRYRQLYDRWVGPSSPVDENTDPILLEFMSRLRSLPQ